MPKRPCLACGALISSGSYCPRHRPARERLNPARRNGWQASMWRKRVLASTGGRCAVCGSTDRVTAHLVHALADGGHGEGDGVPLCHRHHAQVTAAQRQR